jgi:hypothetical protein
MANTRASAVVGCIAAVLSFSAAAVPRGGETDAALEAVWKVQQLDFEYRADRTFYTCANLVGKIEAILVGVGARKNIAFREYACSDMAGRMRFQIVFESPVPATAENVRALTTYSSTDRLVAQVRGERLTSAEDVQRFPATWHDISFSRNRPLGLAPSDCELVAQIRQQILSKLSIRIVRDNLQCQFIVPGNVRRPQLTVSALLPVRTSRD